MRTRFLASCAVGALLCVAVRAQANIVVYDNLTTSATAGYSEAYANALTMGDTLTLSQGGVLGAVGLSLFNSTSGANTGAILTGTTLINIYDNTTPYAGSGPITNTLLGTTTVNWDFTAGGGLAAGFFTTGLFDVSALNITVPTSILITQQFTQTTGTSTRVGAVLFSNPVVGSSPNSAYIKSTATPEGLYTFGTNAGQFGYQIQIVPEPGTISLLGLGLFSLIRRRR